MPSSAVKTCALRSEEHTSELQSHDKLVCPLLLEKKNARPKARTGETAAAPGGSRQRARPATRAPTHPTPATPIPATPPPAPPPASFFLKNGETTTTSSFPSPAALRI